MNDIQTPFQIIHFRQNLTVKYGTYTLVPNNSKIPIYYWYSIHNGILPHSISHM